MKKLLIILLVLLGCILVYKIFNSVKMQFAGTQDTIPAFDKFPVTKEHIYQNSRTTYGVDGWLNGDTKDQFRPDYSFLNGPDGPHEISIRFPEEWQAVPRVVRVYDWGEGQYPIHPATKFFLVRKSDGAEIQIGQFDGKAYGQWLEFKLPDSVKPFVADRLIARGYAVFGGSQGACDCYGSEIEIYGDYEKAPVPDFNRDRKPLKNMLGSNGFWWDFTKDEKTQAPAISEITVKTNRFSEMGLSSYRFYFTWNDFEKGEDEFSFQPTIQGWYTDTCFQICKRRGIEPLMTIMGMPEYLYNTWPEKKGDMYRSPVTYENKDKREVPASYSRAARMAFVASARYGRNKNIPDEMMGTYYVHPETWKANDRLQKGLNLVKYMEILNEPDAFWGGRYTYMDGSKLAAFMSAIYDGHKGTLTAGFGPGKGVGIKNADSTMMVLISGMAIASTDALHGIYDWSRKNRGLKADGSVDLPFDIINYHDYSTDALNPTIIATTALPPELGTALKNARSFIDFSNRYADKKEVWLSEWGYDYHDSSMYQAPSIGLHSKFETIGAWALRNMLLHSSIGVDRLIWFKTFDDDPKDPQYFRTMSLLQLNDPQFQHPRRIVGDYMAQFKNFGDYVFDTVLSTAPYCLRYKKTDGSSIYAIWGVEKTRPASQIKFIPWKGFETVKTVEFIENTGRYSLTIPGNSSVTLHSFQPGSLVTKTQTVKPTGGSYLVPYGMTPVLVEVK